MQNEHQINIILDKIRAAATCGSNLHLTVDETKILADHIGNLRMVPVLTMEQVAELPGQPIVLKD